MESILASTLFPWQHSSDDSADIAVRFPRMGRALLQISEGSGLSVPLVARDDTCFGSRNDCPFRVDAHHAFSVESFLGHVTGHSSQDEVGSVYDLLRLSNDYYLFHFSDIPPSPSSKPRVFALISRAASRTNFSGGNVPVDSTKKLKVFALGS